MAAGTRAAAARAMRLGNGRLPGSIALLLLLLLLGCRGAQSAGSNVHPGGGEGLWAPQRPTRSAEFDRATSSLREQVQLLGAAPGAVDDASARRAVATLADALANAPDAHGVDVTDAAGAMRSGYVDVVGAAGATATAQLRRALLVAANTMTLLARGPYAGERAVARRVARFEQAAAGLDSGEPIEAQPEAVAHALAGAGAALAALDRASSVGLAPPAAGAAEAQPSASTAHRAPFDSSLATYSDAVDALAVAPAAQVPGALLCALDGLAGALRALPTGGARADSESLALVRSFASDMAAAPAQSAAQASFTKGALERAEGILSQHATRSLAQVPAAGREVRAMRVQVAAIDAQRPLAPQLPRVLGALEAAEDALRSMALPP